jgi:predicted unusual protein kinase regulating ubiquinone biosynthesis (AarF/ABC1/UbiB family)
MDSENGGNGELENLVLPEPRVTKHPALLGSLTRMSRNSKFMSYFLPILNRYRKVKGKVDVARRKMKHKDRALYYKRKTELLDEAHRKAAPQVKHLLEQMGGIYNKAAQDICTRGLIVPRVIVDGLLSCFEDNPKRTWKSLEKSVFTSMGDGDEKAGRRLVAQTMDINPEPLAAASIGQVHRGTLHKTGEKVIVKVLYPEMRHFMHADLLNIKQAVSMLSKLMQMSAMKDAIEAMMLETNQVFPRELDFHIEFTHAECGRKLLQSHSPRIVVPRVYAHLSRADVLTQEMLSGGTFLSIYNSGDSSKIKQAQGVFHEIIDALGLMIFRDGFFHSDPHPGNLMLTDDGRPGLIGRTQYTSKHN